MAKITAIARALGCALAVFVLAGSAARAGDGPPMGRYEIRLHTYVAKAGHMQPYSITSHLVLRADGTYEIYDLPGKALRSRGTYVYEAGTAGAPGSLGVIRWKSGLNHEMGRGGSYFPSNPGFGCEQCIQVGKFAIAVLMK